MKWTNTNIKKFNQPDGDEVQANLFHDNISPRNLRKVKGAFVPAENLIELFKNADESTIVHKFAHLRNRINSGHRLNMILFLLNIFYRFQY